MSQFTLPPLVKSFSIYTISQLLNKGIGLLLLPIFTNYLSTKDYGVISLYSSVVSVLTVFMMAGTDGSIRLQYFKLDLDRFRDYFTSSITIPCLIFVVCFFVSFFFSSAVAKWMDVSTFWIYLMPILTVTAIYDQIQLGLYRVEEKPVAFGLFSVSQLSVNMLLGIVLIVTFHQGYEGRLYGMLFSNVLFFLLSFYLFYRRGYLSGVVLKDHLRYALKYGLPIIPHHIGALIINSSDRVFIAQMVSKEALGVYTVGYTIGSLIMLLQDAFVNAFIPFLFKELRVNNGVITKKIKLASFYFIAMLLLALVALTLFTPLVFDLFINEKFGAGSRFVFWVALGYFFLGCYKLYSGYIFYFEKTFMLTYLSIMNVVVNLLLNFVLIKKFGVIGAAYATAISFLLLFVATFLISNSLIRRQTLKDSL